MSRVLTFLRNIGPAIIVAAVVCGPGSILMNSKTGAIFGYDMVWVLVLAAVLMWGMVVLAARLGVTLEHTPIQELTNRLGKWAGLLVGITLFLVVAGFQVSNNIAIVAAVEPFVEPMLGDLGEEERSGTWKLISIAVLLLMNTFIILVLYLFRTIYDPVEKLMKGIVLFMVTAFVINLILTKPNLLAVLGGLIPSPPSEGGFGAFFRVGDAAAADVLVLQALVATTFSVGGAFYQAYTVRAKGWGLSDARKGMVDSLVGISVLGGISLIIMTTAAAGLHGKVDPSELTSVGSIAVQMEPLFGKSAKYIFALGIFAGGFGAFMVNAMIGGNMLSDGLGIGATINDKGARHCTTAALLIGMAIALLCLMLDIKPVVAITIAQASVVLGLPALAGALLYLGTRPELTGDRKIPRWMLVMGGVGLLLALMLAYRTLLKVLSTVQAYLDQAPPA